ncbi:MAG: tRNA epoxyqueuosine(34) reductase QueG [Deltaproteobacteria bacterium]|nr:tRNA epoxyqueuosine(34) reductase QueG [Deltaproteobacteria bacterium]
MDTENFFRINAEALGMLFVGITDLERDRRFDQFTQWISQSKHAGMDYLARNQSFRSCPTQLLPGAKRAIILALPYGKPSPIEETNNQPIVARYAQIPDYHRLLKQRATQLIEAFFRETGNCFAFRVCVDSSPILEKGLAEKTGRGFIGKNTLFIDPQFGSFCLLAEILTSTPLPLTRPVSNPSKHAEGCGTCNKCQINCPTGALKTAYTLDASRCLSYWTGVHSGPIPPEFWPHLARYYYGCDTCQLVCPHNFSKQPLIDLTTLKIPSLFDTATMDPTGFKRYFGNSVMTYLKRNALRRNALIAMAVTKHNRLNEAMEIAGKDDSYPIAETLDAIKSLRRHV